MAAENLALYHKNNVHMKTYQNRKQSYESVRIFYDVTIFMAFLIKSMQPWCILTPDSWSVFNLQMYLYHDHGPQNQP